MADNSALASVMPQASNPLQVSMQGQQLQGLANQNQQFQQQFAARQALGPILQGAVNPETGELDYNKAFVAMSADPRTAFMAPDFLAQGIQKQQIQADTVKTTLDNHAKQQGAIFQAAQGLLPLGNNATKTDLINAATDLVNQGVIDKQHLLPFLQRVQSLPDNGVGQFVQQLAYQANTAQNNLANAAGSYDHVDTGNGIAFTHSNAMLGQPPRVLSFTPKSITPQEGASAVAVRNPVTGEPERETLQQALAQSGWGGGVTPPASGLPGVPTTPGIAPAGAPGIAGAPAPAAAPMASQTPPAGAEAGGGGPPTPPPVQGVPMQRPATGPGAAQEAGFEEYKDFAKTANQEAETGQGMLRTIEPALTLVQGFRAGPGAPTRAEVAQAYLAMGGDKATADKITGGTGSLAAQQTFKSQMMDFAMQRLKDAIKTGKITNLEFQNVLDAKPGPGMQPDASLAILQTARRAAQIALYKQQELNNFTQQQGANPVQFMQQVWPQMQQELMKHQKTFIKQYGPMGLVK